jgi:hypothetical protein
MGMVCTSMVDWTVHHNQLEFGMLLRASISHWWPVVTFCPVNKLPDFLYFTVTFKGETATDIPELYKVRKSIRNAVQWRTMFMEDVAEEVFRCFKTAVKVEVRLLTGRHIVSITEE